MEDLFGFIPDQPDLLGSPPQRKPLTPEDVRAKMLGLIAAVRAAETIPFPPRELQQHCAMFPIMAQWLPEKEGHQLVLEFETEIDRLRKAA
jgi:hypothetical protein